MPEDQLVPDALRPVDRSHLRFASSRTIFALMLREMSTRYGDSPGGYIWAIVEPMGAIVMLSIAFSLIVIAPPLGNSFPLFYATGFLPFSLYLALSQNMSNIIRFSRPLLMYPRVTWMDALLARLLLNALTGIMAAFIIFAVIFALEDTRGVLRLGPILLAMFELILISAGVGALNCVISGLFPVWTQIWGILNRPLFLASGVFFIYDTMPPLAQDILWYNPLMHISGTIRSGFYSNYDPQYIDHTYVLACGLIPLAFGLLLMRRFHRDILNS